MRLIYRGAEADVFEGQWCGLPAVYKVRNPLPYRLPELDNLIRSQRTVREAETIHAAKQAGVRSPHIYYLSGHEALLVMEYVRGERLKTLLDKVSEREATEVAGDLGRSIGALHGQGIVHGDVTTSNVIVEGTGAVRLIDFGLAGHSKRLEDHAVDLRLIKETLTAAHHDLSKTFMDGLMRGYGSALGRARAKAAARKLAEIERRGRYAKVE